MILLLLALAAPNSMLTPGLARALSATSICSITWGRDERHVTLSMRKQVFKSYGISWDKRLDYELDHLIPRSLGGADSILNLWPQPRSEAVHIKDPREVALSKLVCNGKTSLAAAQLEMQRWGQ